MKLIKTKQEESRKSFYFNQLLHAFSSFRCRSFIKEESKLIHKKCVLHLLQLLPLPLHLRFKLLKMWYFVLNLLHLKKTLTVRRGFSRVISESLWTYFTHLHFCNAKDCSLQVLLFLVKLRFHIYKGSFQCLQTSVTISCSIMFCKAMPLLLSKKHGHCHC